MTIDRPPLPGHCWPKTANGIHGAKPNFAGGLRLHFPLDADMPSSLNARVRVSRYPAQCTVARGNGRTYQKLSHRAPEGGPSAWGEIDYDDTVFTDEMRSQYRTASITVPVTPSPAGTSPSVTEPPPKAEKVTEDKFPPKDGLEEKKKKDKSDHGEYLGWGASHVNPNGWRPRSQSWNEWSPHNDRKEENESEEEESSQKSDTGHSPPASPKSSPPGPVAVTIPIPGPVFTTKPPKAKAAPDLSPPPEPLPPAPQSAPPTFSKKDTAPLTPASSPQSPVTVTAQAQGPTVSLNTRTLSLLCELQALSHAGPPPPREDRLARQSLAAQLAMSPDLYNRLVFGEDDDATDAAPPPNLPSTSG